jgi:hypothetical protein
MEIYCAGIDGTHEYAERICPACGQEFCFTCCGATNIHEGGKYQPDFMECPVCGWDIYSEDDPSEYKKKIRRRIEDRLRKDEKFFREVLELFSAPLFQCSSCGKVEHIHTTATTVRQWCDNCCTNALIEAMGISESDVEGMRTTWKPIR